MHIFDASAFVSFISIYILIALLEECSQAEALILG